MTISSRLLAALTVAAMLVAMLPGTASVAQARVPTCQGEQATIVGKPGKALVGTPEADVVVTNGSSSLSSGDGDDVVCVTGATIAAKGGPFQGGPKVLIWAEAGNDSVEVSGSTPVLAFLGDGDDRFKGGDEIDVVWGGYPDTDYDHVDDGTDTIRTGGGADEVRSASNDDVLQLGRGNDSLIWGAFSGEADGGLGRNSVLLRGSDPSPVPGSWLLDNRVGEMSNHGVVQFYFKNFNEFRVAVFDGGPLTIRGNNEDETFHALASPLTVEAGSGDDEIYVEHWAESFGVASLNGGGGRDGVSVLKNVGSGETSIDLDLEKDEYRYELGETRGTVPVLGIEDAEVTGFPQVTLRGDSASNRLVARVVQAEGRTFEFCRVKVIGRGGDDVLKLESGPIRPTTKHCPTPTLAGNRGDDLLIGARTGDRLLGGSGRDVARGGPGIDVCWAETRSSCER